ncbi:MAG: hypothetical protein JWR77_203 [Rhizorhabdus sp.]|nr:hypothetical protein [Rhizorhabdus sp.]
MLARRFLYVIAGLIMFVLAAGIGWNLFQDQLMRMAFVPGTAFRPAAPATAPDYMSPTGWLSRPDIADDPSRWVPDGQARAGAPEIAVFYVPPTTYFSKSSWNAPLDDRESRKWLRVFASSQASAFNNVGAVWAPRYRQATLGAFLTKNADGTKALDFAYQDVLRAFDAFIAQIPASRPILLAGHSQGSVHLMRLMHERIAGKPIASRIVAAYLVGWPISIDADIPAMGLPACSMPGEANCILSWQSFAEPAEPKQFLEPYETSIGLTGKPRRGTAMLCVNPLTGARDTAALPGANLGALYPRADFKGADLKAAVIPARCDKSGVLLIGAPPTGYDRYVMPGNNYHVFDYALFWANIRADALARTRTFLKR